MCSVGVLGTDIICHMTPAIEVNVLNHLPLFHKFVFTQNLPLNLLGRDLMHKLSLGLPDYSRPFHLHAGEAVGVAMVDSRAWSWGTYIGFVKKLKLKDGSVPIVHDSAAPPEEVRVTFNLLWLFVNRSSTEERGGLSRAHYHVKRYPPIRVAVNRAVFEKETLESNNALKTVNLKKIKHIHKPYRKYKSYRISMLWTSETLVFDILEQSLQFMK